MRSINVCVCRESDAVNKCYCVCRESDAVSKCMHTQTFVCAGRVMRSHKCLCVQGE